MRNASATSEWVAITLASGKTLIGKAVDFGEDDWTSVEEPLEVIIETAMTQGRATRRFLVVPWGDLVDDSTIDIDIAGAVVVHFQNMGPVDRETYEDFVRQGKEIRNTIRASKLRAYERIMRAALDGNAPSADPEATQGPRP